MTHDDLETPPPGFGSWQDAEELRKWSFRRRTPQQRLDWLVDALTIHMAAQTLAPATTRVRPPRAPPCPR